MGIVEILMGVIGGLAAVIGVWFAGVRSGSKRQRNERAANDLKDIADRINLREKAEENARAAEAAKELKEKWSRD